MITFYSFIILIQIILTSQTRSKDLKTFWVGSTWNLNSEKLNKTAKDVLASLWKSMYEPQPNTILIAVYWLNWAFMTSKIVSKQNTIQNKYMYNTNSAKDENELCICTFIAIANSSKRECVGPCQTVLMRKTLQRRTKVCCQNKQ